MNYRKKRMFIEKKKWKKQIVYYKIFKNMEKTKNKNLKFLTMVIVFCIGFLNTIVQFSFGQDLLEDVFLNAKSSQSIIDI